MLAAIRAFSKSWVALVLFGFLLISLMVWGGMSDMFKNSVSSAVVKVGSHEMQPADFEARFNQTLDNIAKQENGGKPIPREEAIKAHFPEQLMQSIAGELSMAEAITRLGIHPAPNLIAEQLKKLPSQVFDPVTGKFDKNAYRQLLAENHLTVQTFEAGLSDDLAKEQLVSSFQAGMLPPRVYGALVAINQLENRSWSSFTLDPAKMPQPPTPTDAQLNAFIKELGDRVKKPETRDLSFVRFSTKAAAPSITVDPAEVEKLYNFRKDSLSQPETRSLIRIPAKTAAQAQKAADALNKGQDPAAVAKSLGVAPIVYDAKPKTAISDRKVADAAFALPVGKVSGPIQGDLGFAVVKVTDIKPGSSVTLAQARPTLEAEVRHDDAQKKVYAQVEAYQKAHEAGPQMPEAAKSVGAEVINSGPINANGYGADGKRPDGLSPALVAKAFSMAPNEESDVEDEGGGEYYVVKVNKVTPAAMPTLDEVRKPATDAFIARELQDALRKQADALAARIRKGESFEAVAASAGVSVDHTVGEDRATIEPKMDAMGKDLVASVFSAAKGDVLITPGTNNVLQITKIDSILPGAIDKMAPVAEASRQRIAGDLLNEMLQEAQTTAQRLMKPKTDAKRAAQALGVTPDQLAPTAPPAPAPKAKG